MEKRSPHQQRKLLEWIATHRFEISIRKSCCFCYENARGVGYMYYASLPDGGFRPLLVCKSCEKEHMNPPRK